MQDISSTLESVDVYFDNTQEEIWRLESKLFEPSYNQILYKLRTFPSDVLAQVGTSTGAEPLFSNLEEYVDYIPKLVQTLNDTQDTTESLENQAFNLNTTLESIISNFRNDFASCHLQQCNISKDIMAALEVTANFTGQDLEPIIQEIQSILYGPENITATMQQGRDEYNQIQEIVASATNDSVSDFQAEFGNYANEFYSYINETIDKIGDLDVSKARRDINQTITKKVDDIGYYAYISLNAISSIALLIVTLFFLALMFGCCGDRAGENATFCNRGNGASTLVLAMVTFFVLSWILMISTTAMFLGGGLSYTEVCRKFIFQESQDDLVVLDNIVTSYFNISGASARTIMTNCDRNMPFYQAFEVEKHYPELNISKALDLSVFDFDGTLEELLSENYAIGNVTMLNNATETHLITMEDAVQIIDIELYTNMAQQSITNYNLRNISQLFDKYADDLESTDPTISNLFRTYRQQLDAIHNVEIANMTQRMDEISQMMGSIQTYDSSLNLSVFIPEMESAQNAITSEEIMNAVNVTVNVIFDELTFLASSIEFAVFNMIGRCYSVYNAISVSISSVCISFLYPFNAFWFSMGWSLFFFTLSIPVALSLVTQYRKSVPYMPTHEAISRPRIHRGQPLNQDASGVRSSLVSGRGGNQNAHHQGAPPPMPNAPPPYDNDGFIPDDPDYDDDRGFIEFHRSEGNQQSPPRGNPIRPTQNYVIELRPRRPPFQRTYGENGVEDYF